MRALRAGRRGRGHELNRTYWLDSCSYAADVVLKLDSPTLFDALDLPDDDNDLEQAA